MTGLVGSFQEAWGEVRVHRARVVLSLVGVVLAVFAMTVVTAAGEIGKQILLESNERQGGRATTLSVSAWGETNHDPAAAGAALESVVDRYGVQYSSTVQWLDFGPLPQNQNEYVNAQLVEPDYGVIHRITPSSGRWFGPGDAERLSPAVVVNRKYLQAAGLEGRVPPFTVPLTTDPQVSGVVIGVVDRNGWSPELLMLPEAAQLLPARMTTNGSMSVELWVPPEHAGMIESEIPKVLAAQGFQGNAYPMSDQQLLQVISIIQWVIRGLSWFALGLGALGVLNVGIVTVRQRVREIGVRRALGASSTRVFSAVVLESVCATALAGVLGVALAVALVVNVPLDLLLGDLGITEIPGFPVSAALEGFLTATAIGALIGLVPATMAVRAKVIDAIRY